MAKLSDIDIPHRSGEEDASFPLPLLRHGLSVRISSLRRSLFHYQPRTSGRDHRSTWQLLISLLRLSSNLSSPFHRLCDCSLSDYLHQTRHRSQSALKSRDVGALPFGAYASYNLSGQIRPSGHEMPLISTI